MPSETTPTRRFPLLHPPATSPSPAPLVDELVELYRLAISRTAPDDVGALLARREAATNLATRAFAERDRAAWEVAQVLLWRLHRRGSSRPTEPGDVLVLDAMVRIEEAQLPPFVAPVHLEGRAFCEQLARDVVVAAHADPDPTDLMCAATRADWRYLGHNMLAEAWDFTRLIALASLPLPHRYARLMYQNLFDEGGRGDWAKAHMNLLATFLRGLDIPVPGFDIPETDDDALLFWSAPEVIAEINVHKRALWHGDPQRSLGAMYIVEQLVPSSFARLVESLRSLGFREEELAYFIEHVEVDGGHASDWMTVVESFIETPEARAATYAAAIESAQWFAQGWEGLCRSWAAWKETGIPPHLPARELRARCGA